MQVYPYRLIGESGKEKVRAALLSLLESWTREWFVSPPAWNVRIETEPPAIADWLVRSEDADLWAACAMKDRAQRDFMHLLLGAGTGNASSAILADVLENCMGDLLQCILPGAGAEPREASDNLDGLRIGPGSGILYAVFDGSLPLHGLALGGAWVEAAATGALPVPTAMPILTPRGRLLGKGEIRVEVRLGDAELPLSELAGIAVGDVLALDVSRHDPLQLRTSDGRHLCKIHLGRSGPHKAIQVISQ